MKKEKEVIAKSEKNVSIYLDTWLNKLINILL